MSSGTFFLNQGNLWRGCRERWETQGSTAPYLHKDVADMCGCLWLMPLLKWGVCVCGEGGFPETQAGQGDFENRGAAPSVPPSSFWDVV